jgi:7,8-dihydroneopterin 2',3'-cyclic phosphate phosphodiesterase
MQKLIELAEKIKDEKLKKKVVEFLEDLRLTHPDFKKYEKADIEKLKVSFTIGNLGTVERDVLNHTTALVDLCLKVPETIEKVFGVKLNVDNLVASAILHDVMKVFEWKSSKEHSGILLDHSMLAVAELYKRNFPEEIIHIVASHFGEGSSTPPRNFEALIFHYLDTLLSVFEFYFYASKKPAEEIPILIVDKETLKKLKEG